MAKSFYIVDASGALHLVPYSFVDMTGKQIGRLDVVGLSHKEGKFYFYLCKCSCGNEKVVNKRELIVGDTKSCGCLFDESIKNTSKIFTDKYKTHGLAGTREHAAWKRVKARVCNPNDANYEVYSKLGMENEWKSDFVAFLEHMGQIPDDRPRWSVGRVDNNVGYFAGNVRWERDEQQAKNKGKYSNNKSGTTGVYLQNMNKEPYAWVASWYGIDNKQHSKYYTIGKYGDELAKFLAEEKRSIEMLRLKTLGVEYGEHHGL